MEFLIVCPLALIAGFVDAIAGGGGLISLPAYFFAGLPPHAAIATNKLSSTLGTLVATVRYALFGYMVKRFVVAGVACGLVGSAIGANLALLADATVLTVSESGLGRRTEVSQYRLQSRGGKGIRNYYVDRNGPVAGVKMVDGDDDVILITDDGVIIRIPVQEITVQSRYGGGVRAMRVAEDS
ncbi:MAG: TSUP family transporter, partial [Slackia sp.]|nr:TSUP family transporter [Slackia sp.]